MQHLRTNIYYDYDLGWWFSCGLHSVAISWPLRLEPSRRFLPSCEAGMVRHLFYSWLLQEGNSFFLATGQSQVIRFLYGIWLAPDQLFQEVWVEVARFLKTQSQKSQNITSVSFYWSRKSLRPARFKERGIRLHITTEIAKNWQLSLIDRVVVVVPKWTSMVRRNSLKWYICHWKDKSLCLRIFIPSQYHSTSRQYMLNKCLMGQLNHLLNPYIGSRSKMEVVNISGLLGKPGIASILQRSWNLSFFCSICVCYRVICLDQLRHCARCYVGCQDNLGMAFPLRNIDNKSSLPFCWGPIVQPKC